MSETEWLVNSQINQIQTLNSRVDELVGHLKDFEKAALTWKKGYEDMERDYKAKLANAEQTIEELEKEIKELKSQVP